MLLVNFVFATSPRGVTTQKNDIVKCLSQLVALSFCTNGSKNLCLLVITCCAVPPCHDRLYKHSYKAGLTELEISQYCTNSEVKDLSSLYPICINHVRQRFSICVPRGECNSGATFNTNAFP
jgi:hypothetical protein